MFSSVLSNLLTILIPFFRKELKMQRVDLHFMLALRPRKSFVYLAVEYEPLTVPGEILIIGEVL